jgi:hypothetical protein
MCIVRRQDSIEVDPGVEKVAPPGFRVGEHHLSLRPTLFTMSFLFPEPRRLRLGRFRR